MDFQWKRGREPMTLETRLLLLSLDVGSLDGWHEIGDSFSRVNKDFGNKGEGEGVGLPWGFGEGSVGLASPFLFFGPMFSDVRNCRRILLNSILKGLGEGFYFWIGRLGRSEKIHSRTHDCTTCWLPSPQPPLSRQGFSKCSSHFQVQVAQGDLRKNSVHQAHSVQHCSSSYGYPSSSSYPASSSPHLPPYFPRASFNLKSPSKFYRLELDQSTQE